MFASALLLAGVAAALPNSAPYTTNTPSTASAPATTPAATLTARGDLGIFHPSLTVGSTVVDGQTYPVFGGSFEGAAGIPITDLSLTAKYGGYLHTCYAKVDEVVVPAVCYGGHESDSFRFIAIGKTLLAGGQVHATGKDAGAQSFSAGGVFGDPANELAHGHASGFYEPALNPGQTAAGGIGGVGTLTEGLESLLPATLGGKAGATYVTEPGYTTAVAGAVGSVLAH